MQPQAKVTKDFPFQAGLPVCHMLRFEVRDFCPKDRPNTEVLALCRYTAQHTGHHNKRAYLVQHHE